MDMRTLCTLFVTLKTTSLVLEVLQLHFHCHLIQRQGSKNKFSDTCISSFETQPRTIIIIIIVPNLILKSINYEHLPVHVK